MKSFVSTEFCGLCPVQFPSSTLQGLDAWQSKFRDSMLVLNPSWWSHTDAPQVLHLYLHNEDSVKIMDVASLPDIRNDVDVTLTGCPRLDLFLEPLANSTINFLSREPILSIPRQFYHCYLTSCPAHSPLP